MGKHWKSRAKKRKNNSEEVKSYEISKSTTHKLPYEDIVKENSNFEEFYKCQNIVKESEWEQFMTALRDPLPASFRVSADRWQASALKDIIEKHLHRMVDERGGATGARATAGVALSHTALSWYPGGLAWQLNVTRSDIRNSEAYHRLHSFLISETESGSISRQETVSMIPPLVLDVQPHHKVLDMCAAPGSKTAQLIELIHGGAREATGAVSCALPSGLVVANDADNKRCYMLVHQAKRRPSPCFIVTNHDAARMPSLYATQARDQLVKFDRVLCDVPCSGDGTLRKNTDVWPKWNPVNGANLHGLQFNIAYRGLQMLSVGGRLVYSTCSLNPVENEAVVLRLLTSAAGSVRLVDASSLVPGLKFSPGLTHWTPFTKDMKSYNRPEEVPVSQSTVLRPHMFAPVAPSADQLKLVHQLPLCMRILPHQQNTGGFFVAVFEKSGLLPGEKTGLQHCDSSTAASSGSSPARKRARGYTEDPYCFIEEDNQLLSELAEFYELSETLDRRLLMTRCAEVSGRHKNVYLCSPAVRDLLLFNTDHPGSGGASRTAALKVINSGLKVFARCDNKGAACGYRVTQEGCHTLAPFLLRRRVAIAAQDMITVLLCDDIESPTEIASLSAESQKELQTHGVGAIVLESNLGDEGADGARWVRAVGWRGAASLRAYVARHERLHLLRLLGADTSKFDRNKFAEARKTTGRVDKNSADCDANGDNTPATEGASDDQSRAATEGASDDQSRAVTEGVSDDQSRAVTEGVSDDQSRAVTEGVSDDQSRAATEGASDHQSRAATEGASDDQSRAVTEGVSENESLASVARANTDPPPPSDELAAKSVVSHV